MSKWEKVKLSDIFDLQMGKTPSRNCKSYWNNGIYNWVSIADIGKTTKYIYETKEKITENAILESGIKLVPKGTIIMSFKLSLGKTCITGEDIYTNEAIMAFLDKHIYSIDKNYIYHLFSNYNWEQNTNKAVKGITLNKATLGKIKIPLPSLEEQRKIASILDTVSEALKLRKQQLNELELLVKSKFIEMFGDIKENPFNYTALTFKDISSVRQGLQIPISKRKIKPTKYTFPYITIQYLNGKKQAEYIENPPSNVICTKNDILMTRTGNTGMVITNVSGVFHNNFFLIDYNRNRLNKNYLVYYLNNSYIQKEIIRLAGTSTIPDLNHGDFYKIKIIIPPIELQNKFASFVEHVDELKSEVQKSIEQLQMLFDSLMQEYFE